MVPAPCKLGQIRKMIIWQFAIIGGLPYFCGKMGVYVVILGFLKNYYRLRFSPAVATFSTSRTG